MNNNFYLNKFKKLLSKQSILIAITIILILPLLLTGTNAIYENYIKKSNYNTYADLSEERQDLWDKMKISSATISKRTTGTSFNSSSTYESSNMDGIDISGTDEYVKTNDYIYYTVELNVDANTLIEGVTDADEFFGGVIKYKVTLPTNENGVPLLRWSSQNWMTNTSSSGNGTIYYGEYHVPDDTNLVGAIQQLTFTMIAGYNKVELSNGPTFEFWMEGNEPDNEDDHVSEISSYTFQDGPLNITAQESEARVVIQDGYYKKVGYKDGVLGQYWTIGVYGYSYNPSGYGYIAKKLDKTTSKIRLEYYYKDVDASGTTSVPWTQVSAGEELYDETIGKAELIAYNRNGDLNENAYSENYSNYFSGAAGFSTNNYNLNGETHTFDSGTVNADLSNGTITITNDNIDASYIDYISNTNGCISVPYLSNTTLPGNTNTYTSICTSSTKYYFRDSIEIFIPYTELGVADRDYQIKAVAYEIDTENTETLETNTYSSNSTVTTTYSDQAGDVFTGKMYISSSSYTTIRFGALYTASSNFSANQNIYFGEERLINIDTSVFEYYANSSVSYSDGITSTPPEDLIIKYGVYKNDPIGGLNGEDGITPTEEINTSDVDAFYWYDSQTEAKACEDLIANGTVETETTCAVTSLHIQNPSYIGDGKNVKFSFNIKAKDELIDEYVNGTIISGAIRAKIRLYTDEAKTIEKSLSYYYDNSVDSYEPAQYNEYLSTTSAPSPIDAGASAAVYGDYPSISINTFDKKGNSKTYFNVSDDTVHYSVVPSINISTSQSELTHDDYRIMLRLPTQLTFNEDSANIPPTAIHINTSYTYIFWEFENCEIGAALPASCENVDDSIEALKFSADISPLTSNNATLSASFAYTTNYTSSTSSRQYQNTITNEYEYFRYYSSTSSSIFVTNLSGSYTRIKSSTSSVSPNETFEVNNSIYNNSQGTLTEVKTIQKLPTNGDEYGSSYNGNYTIKVTSLLEGQILYYSNSDETTSGITYDSNGKMTIENVDLANDTNWIAVAEGEIIPASATYLATYIPSITTGNVGEFKYEVIPNGDKSGDVFGLKMYASSDNLSSSIATNTNIINVYDRVIKGIAFNDKNRNNLYDSGEEYKDIVLNLYNDDNTLLGTTTTGTDGSYTFSSLTRDNYYITHQINSNYEYVTPNAGDANVSSIMPSTGISPTITGLNVLLDSADGIVENQNIGLRQKESTLTVHHYIENTTTSLSETKASKVYWGDTYQTTAATDISVNYELVSTPTNASGIVNGDITVIYYYKLKEATLTVHHYIENTTTKLSETVTKNVHWGDEYTTNPATDISVNYELVSTPTNASGTVSGNVIVTYYYKLKEATLTVHHYIENTTTKLSETVTKDVHWGDEYTTSKATDISVNYELVATPSNATGTIAGNVTVTYYYRLKSATLTVHHYIENTTTKLSETVTKAVHWGDEYTTNPATDISVNYELVSTPTNAKGTIAGNVTVTYYYRLKSATLTVHHYIEGTTTKLSETITKAVHWGDEYTTNPATDISVNYELVATPSNATGTIAGNVTVTYYYRLKSATLTVHHYIEGTTTKLTDSVAKNVHWGDEYTTNVATVDNNYELVSTPTNASGTIAGNVVVIYYYKLKTATITVHHYIEGTTTKLAETETYTKNYTDTYTTRYAIVDSNYELVATPTNATGTVSGDVTVIYYYKLKTATITVHHYIEGTTTKLAETEKITKKYTEEYTTKAAEVDVNYELVETPTNSTGTVSGDVTVIYYYKLKGSTLTVHYYVEGTTTKLSESIVKSVHWGDEYTTNVATDISVNYELVETPTNATGTIASDSVVVIYYFRLKNATLTIHHYIEGTTTKLADTITENVHWGDPYQTNKATVDSNYELVSTPTNASGTIAGNVTVIYYYRLKTATITVHHYIEGTTTKLAEDVTFTKKYTDTYTTEVAKVNSNYELVSTPDNANGTVSGNVTVIYYYKLKEATLTVHHYIEGTTTSLAADEISTVYYGNTYTTSPSNSVSSNYELVSTPTNATGTVSGNITVTYYYKQKEAKLIVKYLEINTNKVLAPETTKTVYYGDNYTTTSSSSVTGNYEIHSKTDNFEGIVSSDTIEVIYYYQKKDSKLETSITKQGPEEITSKTNPVKYTIKYEAKITDYLGDATITIIDTLPYSIDETKSTLDGGTYNSTNKTISWVISKTNVDASAATKTVSVSKSISLVYTDIVSTERTMTNSVSANIKLDNNERDVENNQVSYLKIPGKVIVHHYVAGTKEKIIADVESTGLVGETYISSSITKDGYKLLNEPEDKNHIYKDEVTEVVYEYERLKFDIVTKVEGEEEEGGTIEGDESVYYGENSTEDKIIIKPKDGYEVSKIIINGEEQNVDKCKDGCVLGVFKNVLEDKAIIVEFVKKSENPDTASNITIISIVGFTILFITSFIVTKIIKPKFIKI